MNGALSSSATYSIYVESTLTKNGLGTLALGGAVRSALAALVIVFIQQSESRDWTIALERVGSVWLGCFVALALTLAFRAAENRLGRRPRGL